VSKDYSNEIGYESLLSDFKRYQKQAPRGVGLTRKGQNIYLQFKTPNTARTPYACNCRFSIDGMIDAVRKAYKVAEKLKSLDSEVEFWEWYNTEIKQDSQLVDDRLTFAEAITKVDTDFWGRLSRTKKKRDRDSPSDQISWWEVYGKFYQHLPDNKLVNWDSIILAVDKYPEGTNNRGEAVSAYKKLARVNDRPDILKKLDTVNTVQTVFRELQSVDLVEFLEWRDKVLGKTKTLHKNCDMESRKAWMWVFSIQIVYALRISEVFAIKNLTEPYRTKDGILISALNDPNNTDNLIFLGDKTLLGTTIKTGSRLARPQIPPKYPDLIELLEIKNPLVPTGKPKSNKPETLVKFYSKEARTRLVRWDAPFTQTHADRSLGNLNGMQSGIPLEIRAQSMGHTPAQNDRNYKNRQSTQTTIDLLLNSNRNAIDFVTALAEAKKLVAEDENNREVIIRLLSIIYQKDSKSLTELL
jgi:hypothetical protein